MSELVEIDDLDYLNGHDLRSVFGQIAECQLVEALGGLAPARRSQLLRKLPPAAAAHLEARLAARGPVTPAAARQAQKTLLEALVRLSRGGQVAFDIPGDVVA